MFGGVMLRKAYELAHMAAFLHAGARPWLTRLADVSFLKSVTVGSIFALDAVVSLRVRNIGVISFVQTLLSWLSTALYPAGCIAVLT